MRPSGFKRGGGYLNGVDVTITGYEFLIGDEAIIKKGDRKGEIFTPLSLVPSFRADGAEEDQSQRLLIGDADNFGGVSKDGLTLDLGEGRITGSCEAAVFIDSLCAGGFPPENFDEDETTLNLEPMIGTRVHLVQDVNADKTKRQGKQKGKDGKEYDRRDLKVKTVIDLPTAKGKPNGAAKTPAKKAAAGKTAQVDLAALASDTLREILADADNNSIKIAKLKMAVIAKLGVKHPQREGVTVQLADPAFLVDVEGVNYDVKTASVSLA